MAGDFDLAVCVVVGGLFYAAISLKSKLAHRLFGSRIDQVKRKLKLNGSLMLKKRVSEWCPCFKIYWPCLSFSGQGFL